MKKRNVVITGLGTVNPIGIGVDEFWKNAKKGVCGLGPITLFEKEKTLVNVVGEVKNFNLLDHMEAKNVKRMERFTQFAMFASNEAVKDSGLDLEKEDHYRIGVSIGSGIGSIEQVDVNAIRQNERGPRGINPLTIPLIIPNMAASNVSIHFKLFGKNINISTACASSNNSIGEALRTIQYGDADVMLAGGAEAVITPLALNGFANLSAINMTTDPLRASIPFDKERAGFIMGEGAGVLILEEEERAKKRGAKIYAHVLGYGSTSDGYHITAPNGDCLSITRCMQNAIADAKLKPADIDYINAHGTSTKYNDLYETTAIKMCFGKRAKEISINSTKSMIGHLLGACGAVEAIVACKSLQEGYIHPTIGYKVPDPELDLDYTPNKGKKRVINYCLSNNFGFGGHNVSLVFGK